MIKECSEFTNGQGQKISRDNVDKLSKKWLAQVFEKAKKRYDAFESQSNNQSFAKD
jgi:hypothetical protein